MSDVEVWMKVAVVLLFVAVMGVLIDRFAKEEEDDE